MSIAKVCLADANGYNEKAWEIKGNVVLLPAFKFSQMQIICKINISQPPPPPFVTLVVLLSLL